MRQRQLGGPFWRKLWSAVVNIERLLDMGGFQVVVVCVCVWGGGENKNKKKKKAAEFVSLHHATFSANTETEHMAEVMGMGWGGRVVLVVLVSVGVALVVMGPFQRYFSTPSASSFSQHTRTP